MSSALKSPAPSSAMSSAGKTCSVWRAGPIMWLASSPSGDRFFNSFGERLLVMAEMLLRTVFWTSQIRSALAWLDLFLGGVRGTLVRTFSLDGRMWCSQSSSPSTPRPGAWAASSRCKATLCPSSRVPSPTWILRSSATPLAGRLASKCGSPYLPWWHSGLGRGIGRRVVPSSW